MFLDITHETSHTCQTHTKSFIRTQIWNKVDVGIDLTPTRAGVSDYHFSLSSLATVLTTCQSFPKAYNK